MDTMSPVQQAASAHCMWAARLASVLYYILHTQMLLQCALWAEGVAYVLYLLNCTLKNPAYIRPLNLSSVRIIALVTRKITKNQETWEQNKVTKKTKKPKKKKKSN